MNHCVKVPVFDQHALNAKCPSSQKLATGWVGVKEGKFYFKPSRGSGGFALYDTEAGARRNTGCTEAVKVSLTLFT